MFKMMMNETMIWTRIAAALAGAAALTSSASPVEAAAFEVAEAGLRRLSFRLQAPEAVSFDVSVNGRWAGNLVAPKTDGTNSYTVIFDAAFAAGRNAVTVAPDGDIVPRILGVSLSSPRPAPGLETARWQREIDRVSAAGGGRVTIPAGRHPTGGLVLGSNVELHLEKGAVLQGVPGLENYRVWSLPHSEGTWSAVVAAVGVTNVAVTGEGEINGNGSGWELPPYNYANSEGLRARGLFFADSKAVRLDGFLLRDTGCWGCVFKCCDGVKVRGVRIDNHSNISNDGFDMELANAVFENCEVDAGDDAYVFKSNDPGFAVTNVTIRNSLARSHCNAFKIGTATHGVVRGIRIENCRAFPALRDFNETRHYDPYFGRPFYSHRFGFDDAYTVGVGTSAVAIECVDGGAVEEITVDGLEFHGYKVPLFIRSGTRRGRSCATPPGNLYRLGDIVIRNLWGEAAEALASSVTGVDGCRVRNVTLENIHVLCRGAGSERSAEALRTPLPDVAGRYPEATMFNHLLPAWGLYAEKTDGLQLDNVNFLLRPGETDLRPKISEVR